MNRLLGCFLALLACAPTDSSSSSTTPPPTVTSATTVTAGSSSSTTCWEAAPGPGTNVRFEDATEALGLVDPLLGMRGHAAAWGDVNGDGWLDLAVGTFGGASAETYEARGAVGPSPDRLLLGGPEGFSLVDSFVDGEARTSGAAFADLDNDADVDLVLSRYPNERAPAPTVLMDNQGGQFREVANSGLDLSSLAGRSVGVLDFDRDGLLDLLLVADPRGDGSSHLLHNQGGLQFADVTEDAFVTGVLGLGIATADLNDDSYTDVFIAGSNRLFVGNAAGRLEEVDSDIFQWEVFGPEDDVAGVAIADLNRDLRPDLVVGHHFNSTLSRGSLVPIRIYLNQTEGAGTDPSFTDITEEAGMPGLPTKAPHIEILDIDNDGWPDILSTASAGEQPALFMHQGLTNGLPHFTTPEGLGPPQYWVTGPTADVNRDGRLDVFLAEWDPALPSQLLLNTGESGNWISVEIDATLGGGIGVSIAVYEPGREGDLDGLLGMREITASSGYTAGASPWAHFGLGDTATVDLRISLPSGETLAVDDVAANRHLRLPNGCVTSP
ncbi:MAG: CRTAC1 family protein [Acidimicrobiia bacterium]